MGDVDADYIQTATILNTRPFSADLKGYQYNFLPIDDGTWRRVQMDTEWLNGLTPPLPSNRPGWNSLAALLTNIGLDNSTGLIFELNDVTSMLETVIATLVADGMSPQGYAGNTGPLQHFSDAQNLLPWDNSASSQQSMLAGSYSFPPPAGTATQLRWSVVVAGYAYRADSAAYYLALTVLFLHASLALGHMVYVLWTRVCCDAWDSFVGLVVLARRYVSGSCLHRALLRRVGRTSRLSLATRSLRRGIGPGKLAGLMGSARGRILPVPFLWVKSRS